MPRPSSKRPAQSSKLLRFNDPELYYQRFIYQKKGHLKVAFFFALCVVY
jgi:hypothetical protein